MVSLHNWQFQFELEMTQSLAKLMQSQHKYTPSITEIDKVYILLLADLVTGDVFFVICSGTVHVMCLF